MIIQQIRSGHDNPCLQCKSPKGILLKIPASSIRSLTANRYSDTLIEKYEDVCQDSLGLQFLSWDYYPRHHDHHWDLLYIQILHLSQIQKKVTQYQLEFAKVNSVKIYLINVLVLQQQLSRLATILYSRPGNNLDLFARLAINKKIPAENIRNFQGENLEFQRKIKKRNQLFVNRSFFTIFVYSFEVKMSIVEYSVHIKTPLWFFSQAIVNIKVFRPI